MLTHPSGLFGDNISAIGWCWPIKFLHALAIHLGLLARTQTGTGVPQKILRTNNI